MTYPEIPKELLQQWINESTGPEYELELATRAGQWFVDQEFEKILNHLRVEYLWHPGAIDELRNALHPNPKTPVEQALEDLDELGSHYIGLGSAERIKRIRSVLLEKQNG